jgi:hypothetical protein
MISKKALFKIKSIKQTCAVIKKQIFSKLPERCEINCAHSMHYFMTHDDLYLQSRSRIKMTPK